MKIRFLIKESSEQGFLFHCTHLWKLQSIAEEGLRGVRKSQFGSGYEHHSSGKVFLCDDHGINFWLGRMEDIANHNSDFNDEEDLGWLPVCLRIHKTSAGTLQNDDIGSRDSREDSWFVTTTIEPNAIQLWVGDSWAELREVDLDELFERAKQEAEFEQEDDGEMLIHANFNTFLPGA